MSGVQERELNAWNNPGLTAHVTGRGLARVVGVLGSKWAEQ